MKAVVLEPAPEGNELRMLEVPDPVTGPSDLLVKVRASALNRADLRRASTHFAGSEARPGPAVGGLEMAGEVLATGSETDGFAVGERVMAMTGGSWAELTTVDHRLAVAVPSGLSWAEAAATPISFITAHDALATAAELQPGESVLVQGATSAAGLASIQLASALGAAEVFGTTSSDTKAARLSALGCTVPLNPGHDDIVLEVARRTGGRGVEVVIDIVGAGVVQQNIDVAAICGRVICLGRLAGSEAALNLDEFSRKRIRMVGVTFRTRSLEERIAVMGRFSREVAPMLQSGRVRPVLDQTFLLTDIEAAEHYMRTNEHFGKIVLALP